MKLKNLFSALRKKSIDSETEILPAVNLQTEADPSELEFQSVNFPKTSEFDNELSKPDEVKSENFEKFEESENPGAAVQTVEAAAAEESMEELLDLPVNNPDDCQSLTDSGFEKIEELVEMELKDNFSEQSLNLISAEPQIEVEPNEIAASAVEEEILQLPSYSDDLSEEHAPKTSTGESFSGDNSFYKNDAAADELLELNHLF